MLPAWACPAGCALPAVLQAGSRAPDSAAGSEHCLSRAGKRSSGLRRCAAFRRSGVQQPGPSPQPSPSHWLTLASLLSACSLGTHPAPSTALLPYPPPLALFPPAVHQPLDIEYSILKQRLARRLRFEGHDDTTLGEFDLVDLTKARGASSFALSPQSFRPEPQFFRPEPNSRGGQWVEALAVV